MLITCPNCEAGYNVPDHLLAGEGRRLRCKSCTEEWHVVLPPEQAPEIEESTTAEAKLASGQALSEIEITAPPAIAGPSRRPRLPWLAPAAAWAASLVILVSAGAATFHWRADINAAWPASERVFHSHPRPTEGASHG